MSRLVVLGFGLLFAMACASPTKRPAPIEDDQLESENCCCRWTPIGSGGRASYEDLNRMECSEKQGECMGESNCAGTDADAPQ
jgi:hypothetical protein